GRGRGAGAGGAGIAGHGDPQAPGPGGGRKDRRVAGADVLLVGRGEAEPCGGTREPSQVPREREDLAVVDRARLEDAVADREPVVDRGDERLVRTHEPTLVPDRDRHGAQSGPLEAICTRRLALSSVSSHSASGSAPHVMPGPAPKRKVPPSASSHQKAPIAAARSA